MPMHPVAQALLEGYQLGQHGREHGDDLAYRMSRAKSEDTYRQGELDRSDRTLDLQSAEQGIDPYAKFNASEQSSRSDADAALGPGTADALGIRQPVSGDDMSNLAGRMAKKQQAETDYKTAEADWMRRRTSGGAGRATSQQLAAAKATVAHLDALTKMGETLSESQQATYDDAQGTIANVGGFEYHPPTEAELAPKPKKQGLFDRMTGAISGMFSGGGGGHAAAPAPAGAAASDPSTLFLQLRAQGVPFAEAKRRAGAGQR